MMPSRHCVRSPTKRIRSATSLKALAREMIADMLLEAKRPQQSLAEYQTDLKLYPNRFDGLYGAARAAEAAGRQDQATHYYAQLVKNCEGSSSERPELSRAKEL